MPKKTTPPPDPPWQVILEDIQSQNRATLEAVQASRAESKRELDDFREETRENFATVFAVLRSHTSDIAELKTDVGGLKTDVGGLKTDVAGLKTDVGGLKTDVARLAAGLERVEGKVGDLSTLESRVAALERSNR